MIYDFKTKKIIKDKYDLSPIAFLWEKEKRNLKKLFMKVSLIKNKDQYIKKLKEKQVIFPIVVENKTCGIITLEKWGDNNEISFWISKESYGKINFQSYLKEALDFINKQYKKPLVWGIREGNEKSYYLSWKYNFEPLFSFGDMILDFSDEHIVTVFSCNYNQIKKPKGVLFDNFEGDIGLFSTIFKKLNDEPFGFQAQHGNSYYSLVSNMEYGSANVSLINLSLAIFTSKTEKTQESKYILNLIKSVCAIFKNTCNTNPKHIDICFDIQKNLFIINAFNKKEEIWLELNPVNLYWL